MAAKVAASSKRSSRASAGAVKSASDNEAMWLCLTTGASAARALRGSRRASSQQYQARRLPPQERALGSCMRWLGRSLLLVHR